MAVNDKEFTLEAFFQTERRLLQFFGTYPRNRPVINVRMCFTWALLIHYFLSVLLIVDFHGIATILAQSCSMLLELGLIVKVLLFVLKGHRITECDELLKDHISSITSKTDLQNLRNVHILAVSYRFMCCSAVIMGLVTPLIQQSGRHLIMPSWQPYKLDEDYKFWMTLLVQVIGFIASSMNNSTVDVIFYKLATVLCCQIHILGENLKKIDFTAEKNIYTDKFKNNIRHHIIILQVAKKMDEVYSGITLVQCLVSVPIICSVGFQVTRNVPGSEEFVFMILYVTVMVLEISGYCWYGHNVLVESSKLETTFYISNWYESDVKFRKSVTTFLERLKLPIIFKAGGVFNVSLDTLIVILKSSLSYMIVLQHLLNETDT